MTATAYPRSPMAASERRISTGDRQSFVLDVTKWAGGACDVGRKHHPNQDALAVAAGIDISGRPMATIAVSDGVSTSPDSDLASALAVESITRQTVAWLEDTVDPSLHLMARQLLSAFGAVNQEIEVAAGDPRSDGYACTLITALAWRNQILVANVGDSRTYWVPDAGKTIRLSVDDSLAQARIQLGMDRQLAESGAQAHAITKWLGPGAGDTRPSLMKLTVREPGWMVVCTDGLWNYASATPALAATLSAAIDRVRLATRTPRAALIASELVAWANAQGGGDNISVGLLRMSPGVALGRIE